MGQKAKKYARVLIRTEKIMTRLTTRYLLCVLILLLSLCMVPVEGSKEAPVEMGKMVSVEGSCLVPPDRAKELQRHGYSTDTPEQIIEASKSESYFVRRIALELLVERIKEGAIPILKEALNDPRIEVRWRVASWLGKLSDTSGIKRMRQDLRELAPNNGVPLPQDPNITSQMEIKKQQNIRNMRLYNALTAAKALAELGDLSGYQLAARMALEGTMTWQRYEAIFTLIEIAKKDQATLTAKGVDPVFVLNVVAESEKDKNVIYLLANQVRKNLSDDVSIQILESAINSTNSSEKSRRVVQRHLDQVKAKSKTPEK